MTRWAPLASKRNPNWAFMDRFEVPDYDHPENNYLVRWRIVQTPLFGIYLHRMDGPDPRSTLHDHPWRFVSFILRGGYIERRRDPATLDVASRAVRRVNRMGLQDAHTIAGLLRQPTWTLLLVGRRVRTWGYLEPVGNMAGSRVPFEDEPHHIVWRWTEFDKHRHSDDFGKAMAARRAMR